MSRPPYQFREFIGQRRKVEPLIREVRGAKARGTPACHILLTGLSGTGKSTLARALAQEYGTRFVKLSGDVGQPRLVSELRNVRRLDFLFIDEAHGLPVALQELLFLAIDGEQIECNDGSEPLLVPPFTVVLATDKPGGLKNAMHKRIPSTLHLDPYGDHELRAIVEQVAAKEGVSLTPQAASLLAGTCHGLPRKAEHRVRKLRLHYPDAEEVSFSSEQVREFLDAFEIDSSGFGAHERNYLNHLHQEGASSLETLAAILNVDKAFVTQQVEHALIHNKLIAITRSGRRLTQAGLAWARNHEALQTLEQEFATEAVDTLAIAQ